jgi:hypothetical protein
METFSPVTSGIFIAKLNSNFISELAERVRGGLFPLASKHRNAYEVIAQSHNTLHFRSSNFWTGINIGLNDVFVKLNQADQVEYTIRYWTWTKYVVVLGIALFLVGVVAITAGPKILPAVWFVEVKRSPWIGISMLVFWGLLWPWGMVAIHKRSVRRCFEQILDAVNRGCSNMSKS